MFDERFVHFVKEILDALVVSIVMDHDESRLAGGHKSRHKPLIEFIDGFQIHVVRFPFVFVDQIEGGMGNELVQMTVVFFLCVWKGCNNCNCGCGGRNG